MDANLSQEVNSVLAAMRLNSRWSTKTRPLNAHYHESPLLKGFKELRQILESNDDLSILDPIVYLKPFLVIIRSEETSGPITGVALSSVNKFLKGFITSRSLNATKALEAIAESVTHCRFEATDPDSDEVVLMKILQVLLSCLKSSIGFMLADEIIIDMVQTCFRMSNQLRLSELLRKTAEQTLTEMILTIYSTANDDATHGGSVYSVTCLFKLLQFVASLINPPSGTAGEPERLDEDICLLGLNLIILILETSGKSLIIKDMQLLRFLQDDLCKQLLKCCQSDNLMIFNRSLTGFFNLFKHAKQHLKPQLELFFMIITRESKSTSYEQLEITLELILDLCRDPWFIVELYVNYDCDAQCSNVFENLCKFLYKNAFPVNGALYTTHILSLDSLLSVVQSLANRLQHSARDTEATHMLRQRKHAKNVLAAATEYFNKDPEEGIAFLKSNQLIPLESDPKSVAEFLRTGYGLNKTVIGEYLGKKKDFNIAVLEAYVQTFSFHAESKFVDCIRAFLESFRIPGEAPIIARVLETFAKNYFTVVKDPFANSDAAYILSYSIVLLNVDQHNPQVVHKMTEAEFIRNNRGINDKKDLPQEMLKDVYYSIKNNEIKIPEEHLGLDIQTSWRHVINRAKILGEFKQVTTAAHDQDIFTVIWGPLIAAMSVVYDTAEDELTLIKTTNAFSLCARISSYYALTDVLDNLVISLCKFSTLLTISGPTAITAFGRNKKAQQATLCVFNITRSHTYYLREGWKNIVNCIVTLQKLGILPNVAEKLEALSLDNSDPTTPSTLLPYPNYMVDTTPPQQARGSSLFGLLGTGSWFGGSTTTSVDDEEPFVQDPNAEETAKRVARECLIKEMISDSKTTTIESLVSLIKAVTTYASKPAKPSPSSSFDEKMGIFCVDLLITIVVLNEHRLASFWSFVSDHLTGIVVTANTWSPYVDKAIVTLHQLCILLVHKVADPSQLLGSLRALTKTESPIAETVAKKLLVGLGKLIEKNPSFIKLDSNLETVGCIIEFASHFVSCEFMAIKFLQNTFSGGDAVTPWNFRCWVDIVTSFTKVKCRPDTVIQSLDLLYSLYGKVNSLLNITTGFLDSNSPLEHEAWEMWAHILKIFGALCKDPRADIRNQAMTYLQKALLSSNLSVLSATGWHRCFEQVVFPLLRELLKPLSASGTPSKVELASLEEIRLRASALLSKIFLQYLSKIIHLKEFSKLWLEILQFLELYMKVEDSELLSEAVRESLKNILLVMTATGIFKPVGNSTSTDDIWTLSWNTIDTFCPSLKMEFEMIYK